MLREPAKLEKQDWLGDMAADPAGMQPPRNPSPETKKARISAGLSNGGAGTKSRTRDLLITSQGLTLNVSTATAANPQCC